MQNPPLLEASVGISIPFFDIDVMEVVWHGHYVKYFEIARCALLDKIDYNYPQMKESGYAWPVVDLQIRYVKPALFNEIIDVKASMLEYEHRLKIAYLITRQQTGEVLSKGLTTQVAINVEKDEMEFISPTILHEKMGVK